MRRKVGRNLKHCQQQQKLQFWFQLKIGQELSSRNTTKGRRTFQKWNLQVKTVFAWTFKFSFNISLPNWQCMVCFDSVRSTYKIIILSEPWYWCVLYHIWSKDWGPPTWKMFFNQCCSYFSDVKIRLEKEEVNAHKLVLSARNESWGNLPDKTVLGKKADASSAS